MGTRLKLSTLDLTSCDSQPRPFYGTPKLQISTSSRTSAWVLMEPSPAIGVALLVCLLGLYSPRPATPLNEACDRTTLIIYVSANGTDAPNCTNGTEGAACGSLSYALSPSSLNPCTAVCITSNLTLDEPVIVYQNVSELEIRGTSADTRVECQFGAGISFEGVDDVTVLNISWIDCSVGYEFNDSSSESVILHTALYFSGGRNITINGCEFTSSRGSGVCMNNVQGAVFITNSIFLNNSILIPCVNGSSSCYNQSLGLQVLGTNMSHSVYTVEGCTFEGNDNSLAASFTRTQDILNYHRHRTVSHGGGLEIRLTGESSSNEFTVEHCSFTYNLALWGAGMEVGLGDRSTSNKVDVNWCSFSRNRGLTGGGLRVALFPSVNYDGYGAEDMNNTYTVSYCNFTENSAESSAGLSYIANRQTSPTGSNSSHLSIVNCKFVDNVASVSGAAIGLTAWHNEIGGYPTIATIRNCTFEGNNISYVIDITKNYGIAVVYTTGILLLVADSQFVGNQGSVLVISSTTVVLAGEVLFDDNFGIHGGALHLMGSAWITLNKGLHLTFRDNRAFLSGGAVYSSFYIPQPTSDTRFCMIVYEDPTVQESDWNVTVSFEGNTAKLSGPSFFASTPGGCFRDNGTMPFSNSHIFHYYNGTQENQTSTPPQTIRFGDPAVPVNGSFSTQVMLGEPFEIHPLTVDVYNHSTGGTAVLELYICPDNSTACVDDTSYSLVGQDLLQLDNVRRTTSFYLTGPESTEEDVFLLAFSDSFPSAVGFLHLDFVSCHLGYVYNSKLSKCTCVASDRVYCDAGRACVKYGYWIGSVKGRTTYSNCPSGNCDYVNGRCPISSCGDTFESFCELPETDSDKLCSGHRGGILCTGCQPGYTFTYGATQCVPDHTCSTGDAVLLAFLTIVFWAALIVILVLVLKLHLRIGSGQLYCLIYYFGVLQYLTVNELPSTFLSVVVAICSAFLELDPRFLGLIDECFLPKLDNIGHLVLRYIHPLFLAVVVFAFVGITRFWPRFSTVSKQNYSVRALCVLMYLSFTSLSETSLQILSFIRFDRISGVYSKVEPTVAYFDPSKHLPYALLAIIVEVFFVLPFLFVILFAPWLAQVRWINLTRIKPIIDEYQGCYRDSCRWFAGYYLLWRQLVFIFSLIDLGEFGGIFLLQQLSILILAIHAVFMPYKKTWLNVLDIILLTDLAVYSLFNGSTANVVLGNDRSKAIRDAIVHILILVPLVYFIGVCTLKFVVLVWARYKRKHFPSPPVVQTGYQSLESTVSSTLRPNVTFFREREPLIFDHSDHSVDGHHPKSPSSTSFRGRLKLGLGSESSVSDHSEEAQPPHLPWYSRLSQRLATTFRETRRPQQQARPELLASIARDVRECDNYTTTEVAPT